jgi:hypothetical protein
MSKAEFDAMVESGKVQIPDGPPGVTHVTVPPNADAFVPPPSSTVFAEFDVPADQLRVHDRGQGWGRVFGPDSLEAKRATARGEPPPSGAPAATNIEDATPGRGSGA